MSFCELTETNRLLKETPEVERAEVADALEIAEVYSQISEFTGLYAADVNLRLKEISNRIKTKEGVHMFIKHDGKIISHANSAGETSVSGMIGGLLTLPAYRQQGLARKVISAVCRDLANRGKTACLFYDNPKADNLYQSLGFKATNKWTILEKLIKD
jgi:predicted GNAT family acetyltransferase